MAHQQTNLLIVSDLNQVLQININNEQLFFFFFFKIGFPFCPLFSLLQTVWKLKNRLLVRFWTFKNDPKTSTSKCHHNKIHELYSCLFFVVVVDVFVPIAAASLIQSFFCRPCIIKHIQYSSIKGAVPSNPPAIQLRGTWYIPNVASGAPPTRKVKLWLHNKGKRHSMQNEH